MGWPQVQIPRGEVSWRSRADPAEKGKMAFISKERESTGEDATIPPSFMTYHDEVSLSIIYILCRSEKRLELPEIRFEMHFL